MLTALASVLIRSACILAAGLLLQQATRRARAEHRHRIGLAAFVLLLTWPLLSSLLPAIPLVGPARGVARVDVTVRQVAPLLGSASPGHQGRLTPLAIWGAGFAAALIPVLAGYLRLRLLVAKARPLAGGDWPGLLDETCRSIAIAIRPALLAAPINVVPFVFGLRRPCIVLPRDASEWPVLRRRAVLLHELAHIGRGDLFWQLLASLTTALWWFQPLTWVCRARLRRESEHACDERVVAVGMRPSDYARQLLEIASDYQAAVLPRTVAIGVARPGALERRLLAILEPCPADDRSGTAGRHRFRAALAALSLVTVVVSALTVFPFPATAQGGHHMRNTLLAGLLTSAGLSAATIGGSVVDPNGAALPGASALLTNVETSARQEVTTGPDGTFAFPALAAGPYILRVQKPGYAALYREFNVLQETDVRRGLVLKTGAQNAADEPPLTGQIAAVQDGDGQVVPIPGAVQQNKLIVKVQPTYPASAKSAGIQGDVELEAVISGEGVPEDISVLSSPSDDLTQSALEAVRQWRYRPTLLNGQPVRIITQVNISYTLSR